MEIFGIGLPEIALIMVVALIVFGPERLPEIAREAGRMVRQFRQMTSEATSEIRSLTGDLDKELKSVTSFVTEEVRTVKNEVTGTMLEQYKATYESVATSEIKTESETIIAEPEVTVTAREVTEAERDEFNRRKMEEFAFSAPSENHNLIESAVESTPATASLNGTTATLPEVATSEWSRPQTGYQLAPDIYSAENGSDSIVPASNEGDTVAPSTNRPKPRIARRSAFGAARHREQEQE